MTSKVTTERGGSPDPQTSVAETASQASDTTAATNTTTSGSTKVPLKSKLIFNKKTAHRYQLMHRSMEDPLINDPDAPTGVFVEMNRKKSPNASTSTDAGHGAQAIKTLHDLESEREKFVDRRDNEGEAAMYGITFDDSKYDYMQHLREIGRNDDGPAVFIPSVKTAAASDRQARLSARQGLLFKEDGKNNDDENSNNILPPEVRPSAVMQKRTYQDSQAVPDAIAGLQPDMDPRLREVLEALEDEEYVQDDDDDIFNKLVTDAHDDDEDNEFVQHDEAEYDQDGWQSDEDIGRQVATDLDLADDAQDWEKEFARFKISQAAKQRGFVGSDDEDDQDEVGSLVSFAKGKKRITGARTETSNYSMTSSAMFRNAGLTLLDDRFDQIERMYAESDDDESDGQDLDDVDFDNFSDDDHDNQKSEFEREIDAGTQKNANDNDGRQELRSAAFSAVMDDFLENYNVVGKKLVREPPAITVKDVKTEKSKNQAKNRKKLRGMAQLKEIKEELGKPRTDYLMQRFGYKN
ncbi:Low temperature viability protein [Lipomyces japonicus]|uniref:Low temperature viability protein n=1 Tax=Lipomyces japonicus TaxID=56871 RepID=UPI0034CFA30E